MGSVSKLLDEKVLAFAKKNLKELGKYGMLARKLNAVINAKKHGITKTSDFYGITRSTLSAWIKHVKNEELAKLLAPKERKKKSILNDEQRIKIVEWIKKNSQLTINEIHAKIERSFGLKIGRSTVHREMQKLGLSYITPRPKHFKQDENQVTEFKKKDKQRT